MNVITPFRRDKKRDFASGDGAELLASKVAQVLGTRGPTPGAAGELPWRTDFGSPLHMLRHQRNDAVLRELARVYIREALRRWLPGVELLGVDVASVGASLVVRLRYRGTEHLVNVEG